MARSGSILVVVAFVAGLFAGCVEGDSAAQQEAELQRIQAQGKPVSVYPGQYNFDSPRSEVLAKGIFESKPPVRMFLQSEIDGEDIEIGYWLPDVPEGVTVPVIVHASPYHRPAGSVVRLTGMKTFLHSNFLPHGYAIGTVAVRGTADSGGCMDLMGQKENGDLDQAITWFGGQPWSNGNVAMIGVSYDGSTPWTVAAFGNEHLKTIVPISGVPDLYGLMFRNGSAESRGPLLLNALYYEYGTGVTDANRSAEHRITGIACPESFQGFAAALYSGTYGERDPLGWWAERNRKPGVEQMFKGSILSVQGLQDWNVDPHMVIPWAQQLADDGLYVKQMLGQWDHASPDKRYSNQTPQIYTRYDWAEILLHWFDKWLKDIDSDLGPMVQVQNEKGEWRNDEAFPPRDILWETRHLSVNNELTSEPGAAAAILLTPTPFVGNAAEQVRSMPGFSADFLTKPLESEMLLSGLVRLHVTARPLGAGGHLAAWLYDVDERGAEKRIGWAQLSLRFADGTERSTPVVPNQPLLVKMEFQPLDAAIPAGHQLRVRVWEYQENDRLPGLPPNPVELLVGGSSTSVLMLPIIERDAAAYFEPPMPPAGWKPPAQN